MDRRSFVETCAASATCLSSSLGRNALSGASLRASIAASLAGGLSTAALASDSRPRSYARVLLTDEQGNPIKASSLRAQTNYVFHYPFEATPVFLLNLSQSAQPQRLSTKTRADYAWPGGVGPRQSVVAFSAICAHQLVYPTPQVSFISFRKTKSQKGLQDNMIHCCADHSEYDPAKGAQVQGGPAEQPLCAVLLEHDPKTDRLTAYATLGGELFDEFFRKYEFKLSLDVGPKAKNAVTERAVVRELDKYCRNSIQC